MICRISLSELPPNLTLDEVAERLGISYSEVSRRCSEAGYQFKRKEVKGSAEVIEKLIRAGLSNIQIARALSCSRELARQIRKKLGLPKVENRGRKTGISPFRKAA